MLGLPKENTDKNETQLGKGKSGKKWRHPMRLDLYSGGNDLKAETRVHRCQAVVVAVVVVVVQT